MADRIYEERQFILMDDTEITVRPLPIKPLRKFMKKWSEMENLGTDATEDDLVNIMFECAYIVVSNFNSEVSKTALEESLDMKTMEKVLALGGGIQTGDEVDPKVMA